ncbi:MAG TPA: carbohydrate ABC transporter permease [Firmicutes bacterium]|nr:carbohydrate ABC transporter permease [Bacillota bacterium]
MKEKKLKKTRFSKITVFDVVLLVILGLLALITLYPFYQVLIISVSNTVSYAQHPLYLLPYEFDTLGYRTIFHDKAFFTSLGVTLFVTIVGTALNMLLSVAGAYALSRKTLIGRNVILSLIVFTMLFNGGVIPTYLVINDLGLVNNIWVMVLPSAISTYYLIIMKNYFVSLPSSLLEAAKLDGANEVTILWRIIIPISMPFIATFFLFYAVERWNEWYQAYLYINKTEIQPLQIYLRNVLISMSNNLSSIAKQMMQSHTQRVSTQAIQMATIVVTTVPILCVYPFVQKHFVKGIMVGGIKE